MKIRQLYYQDPGVRSPFAEPLAVSGLTTVWWARLCLYNYLVVKKASNIKKDIMGLVVVLSRIVVERGLPRVLTIVYFWQPTFSIMRTAVLKARRHSV